MVLYVLFRCLSVVKPASSFSDRLVSATSRLTLPVVCKLLPRSEWQNLHILNENSFYKCVTGGNLYTSKMKVIDILFFLICVTFFALRLFYCVIEDIYFFFLVKFSFIKPNLGLCIFKLQWLHLLLMCYIWGSHIGFVEDHVKEFVFFTFQRKVVPWT